MGLPLPLLALALLSLPRPSVATAPPAGPGAGGVMESPAAVGALHDAAERGQAPAARARAELALGQALLQQRLPVSASSYFTRVLQAGPGDASYLPALEALVQVQRELQDEYLIPSLLAGLHEDAWPGLSPESYARVNFLVASVEQRRNDLGAARARLEAIPRSSAVHAKARYLLGVLLVDPHFPGGARNAEALAAFSAVLAPQQGHPEALEATRQLAMLGQARTLYGMGRYAEAVAAYEQVPRFSRYWDQALFENGFARFRNQDLGGALGSLQALHSPQFEGAFEPESRILTGTIYYFSCLYEESKRALSSYDQVYAPMIDRLKPFATNPAKPVEDYYLLVRSGTSDVLPKPVLLWIRSNERLLGVFRLLDQIEREKSLVAAMKDPATRDGLRQALEANAATATKVAGQLAKNRLVEAYRNLKAFSDQAEIIKFETTKAEKELVEAGVDQPALLAHQRLFRPALPGSNWQYWKFEGEFWIDEIGSYRFTLKNGCPGGRAVVAP